MFKTFEEFVNENKVNEYTSTNFKPGETSNEKEVEKILKKIGFKGSASQLRTAEMDIDNHRGGEMFVHVQVHYVESKGKVYGLHQSQYWLRNMDVNVTALYLMEVEPDTVNNNPPESKKIGRIFVPTDEFLRELKKVKVLKRVS